MAEDPKPAANEDAAEGDRAVIDRELARQDEKRRPKGDAAEPLKKQV